MINNTLVHYCGSSAASAAPSCACATTTTTTTGTQLLPVLRPFQQARRSVTSHISAYAGENVLGGGMY
jgi:hypothetical protein